MTKKTQCVSVLALFAVLCPLIALACGDSNPPAKTPPTPSTDDSASANSNASDAAAAASSTSSSTPSSDPTAASASSSSDASAPASSSKPVVIGETKDECTPVGVDFEKRARPKLKDCYATGKKKDPNLEGTVKIKMTIDLKGKIKSVKVMEKTLPDPVANCMLTAVKATPFPEVEKCWDSTLTIPITFPTPK